MQFVHAVEHGVEVAVVVAVDFAIVDLVAATDVEAEEDSAEDIDLHKKQIKCQTNKRITIGY